MASTVEKHIELVIGRRFKGRGMRWTRAGANRLFELRPSQLQKLMVDKGSVPDALQRLERSHREGPQRILPEQTNLQPPAVGEQRGIGATADPFGQEMRPDGLSEGVGVGFLGQL